jgi:3-oxoacyl-[acyl-carrier protein] reductase
MGNRLKGKVALVTGSGQGIGRAIAMGLASEGAKVVTNNRKPKSTDVTNLVGYKLDSLNKERQNKLNKSLEELGGDAESTANEIKKLGGEAIPFYGDVSDFKVAGKFIQTAVDKWGSVDILVNNAGTFRYANIWDMSEEVWDTVTLNKPKSYFNCTRHAVPYMMKNNWGRIINTTSGAWLGGAGQNSNYCAANGGVVSFTSAIAKELVGYGITANAFCPEALTRATVTILARFEKMTEETGTDNDRRVKMFESHQLPEHIAPFLTYLATDEAADITGTVFHLGGERIGIYQQPIIVNEINKTTGGMWTVDELVKIVPKQLLKEYKNPAKQPFPGAKK